MKVNTIQNLINTSVVSFNKSKIKILWLLFVLIKIKSIHYKGGDSFQRNGCKVIHSWWFMCR